MAPYPLQAGQPALAPQGEQAAVALEDSENLPAPEVIAAEIVEDPQAALDQFAAIAASLGSGQGSGT